ncbi:MAG: hypothetical protein U5M23_11890 [Marinagarivorans sp.]|nr:hypothetical protein [Marinagarivorans sp.]
MSLILLPVVGVLVCIFFMAYFTLRIMLVSVAINAVLAGFFALLWRTPEQAQKKRKKEFLIFGSLTLQIVVLCFALVQVKNSLFPDKSEYREKKTSIHSIINNAGIDNKFERVYAIAASAKKSEDQQELERSIIDEFRYSSTDTYFSEVDLVAAQAIYEKEQITLGNTALAPCKSETKGIYTRIVAHRDGPASLMTFLEEHPPQSPNTCPELKALLFFISERCEHAWSWRCAQELDRQKLQYFSQAPTPDDIAKDIQALIRTLWPQ